MAVIRKEVTLCFQELYKQNNQVQCFLDLIYPFKREPGVLILILLTFKLFPFYDVCSLYPTIDTSASKGRKKKKKDNIVNSVILLSFPFYFT